MDGSEAAAPTAGLTPEASAGSRRPRPAEHEGDSHFAVTLSRGLRLLQCFTPDQPMLGNKELAERTGLAKSTVSRFAHTLTELGYLRWDRRSGKYQLGPAILSLGYPLLAGIRLRQAARGAMQMLADDVGGSVSVGIRDRLRIVYVETARSRAFHSQELSDIGMSHPIGRSAIGRAFLAACEPDQQAALLNELRVKEPEQLAEMGKIERNLEEFRVRGFCTSFGDVRVHVHAVGVPYRLRSTGDIFAFNCVIPAFQLKRGQLENEIGPRLVALVRSLAIY